MEEDSLNGSTSIEDNTAYSMGTINSLATGGSYVPPPLTYTDPSQPIQIGQVDPLTGIPAGTQGAGFGTGITDWFKSLFGYGNTAINSTTGLPAVNGSPGSVGGSTPLIGLNPSDPNSFGSQVLAFLKSFGIVLFLLLILIIFLKFGKK